MPTLLGLPGENIPIWGAYLRALHYRPISTKTITSAFILSGGNALAQVITKSKITDWNEIKNYVIWGIILAPLNHIWQDLIAFKGPTNAVAQLFWASFPFIPKTLISFLTLCWFPFLIGPFAVESSDCIRICGISRVSKSPWLGVGNFCQCANVTFRWMNGKTVCDGISF